MEQISAVDKAARIVGGLTKLANLVGVSAPTAHEWKTLKRPVPVQRCVAINRATSGAVTLQELRPADWRDIWPELGQTNANEAQAATQTVASGA